MDVKKKPFTSFEKELIAGLVEKNADVIECRKTDSAACRKKTETWEAIAHKFNQSSLIQEKATSKQIRKYWANCKSKARESKKVEKQRKLSGGGPCTPNMTPDDEAVLPVKPTVLPTIESVDCDDYVDSDADTGLSWKPKKDRFYVDDNILIEDDNMEEEEQPTSPGTPINLNIPTNEPTSADHLIRHEKMLAYRKRRENYVFLDNLRKQMVEDDMAHRKAKYQLELDHLKRIYSLREEEQSIKIKILQLELENIK